MPDDPSIARREPRIALAAIWLCLAGGFALSAITWIALGRIAGYGTLAYLMPLVVDSYIVAAIITWLQPVGPRVARFAYLNMYGAAALGVVSQAIYHCASIWARTGVFWESALALIVGGIPPLFAFLGVHLCGLARRELNDQQNAEPVTVKPQLPASPVPTSPPAAPVQRSIQSAKTPSVSEPEAGNYVLKQAGLDHLSPRGTVTSGPAQPSRPAPVPVRGGALREGRSNSRKRAVTPEIEARIRGLWEQGLTLQEVMKRSGYKRSTCMRIKQALNEIEKENRERVA